MIDIFEIEDLIQAIYEKEEGDIPEDFDSSEFIYAIFGCDYQVFTDIVEKLIDFTPVLESPLTGTLSHCFGVIENPKTGLFRAIVKKDIKNG